MGETLAACWHWIAAALAVLVVVAWSEHAGLAFQILMMTLVTWEVLGLFGHYVLRHVTAHD